MTDKYVHEAIYIYHQLKSIDNKKRTRDISFYIDVTSLVEQKQCERNL